MNQQRQKQQYHNLIHSSSLFCNSRVDYQLHNRILGNTSMRSSRHWIHDTSQNIWLIQTTLCHALGPGSIWSLSRLLYRRIVLCTAHFQSRIVHLGHKPLNRTWNHLFRSWSRCCRDTTGQRMHILRMNLEWSSSHAVHLLLKYGWKKLHNPIALLHHHVLTNTRSTLALSEQFHTWRIYITNSNLANCIDLCNPEVGKICACNHSYCDTPQSNGKFQSSEDHSQASYFWLNSISLDWRKFRSSHMYGHSHFLMRSS